MDNPADLFKPDYRTACGGRFSDPEQYPSAIYQGERVYFCSEACLLAFQADPQRFMAGEIIHPLD